TDPDLGVVVDDHPGHVWRKIMVCFPPTPTSAPLAVAVPSPGYAGGLIRSVTWLPQVPSGGGTFPRLRRGTHPERHMAPPTSACGGGTFPRPRRGVIGS